jgi:outer membrane protein assembly factor BamB
MIPPRPRVAGVLLFGLLGVLASAACPASADDWNQFGGPERDNRSTDEGLLRQWPEEGPRLVGTATNLGIGYSSVSLADGAVLTMGSRGDDEMVICLDEKSLAERWAVRIGATRPDGMGPGPRGTPTIVGDAVYALGANGDMACLALADGRVRWSGNVLANSGAANITWGISESPLVDGGRVVVTPGGPGAAMVAVDAKSGRLLWKAAVPGDPQAGYSSIIVVETGPVRQYVNFVHTGVIGVRADTGQFLWGNDASANGTANCSSPVAWKGNVFSASGYGKGGALVRLAGDRRGVTATLAYATKDLKSHHGGLVVDGDHVYGTDEGLLTCLDLRTGQVAWQNRAVGKGSVVWADGLLVLRSEEGPVALVECSPRGYVERGRFTPAHRSDRPAWPHPVIAEGKLWLRDQETLTVYDVRR